MEVEQLAFHDMKIPAKCSLVPLPNLIFISFQLLWRNVRFSKSW